MAMKALNIKIDETAYEKLRAYSFVQKKPMTAIIREYIESGLENQKELFKKESSKILEVNDDIFKSAMKESFEKFDDVYKKLTQ